jgi:phage/plasmid-like protein (TIGR03299 family)
MAHGITSTDQMMYVGRKPWHGMGVELPQLATAAEAIEGANLGWSVSKEPVITSTGKEVPGKHITIRSDTLDGLGVVGDQYSILQNSAAFEFFDRFTMDPHGPKYETAGSLWSGRKVWMLAKLPDLLQVKGDDTIQPYILLSNSHDGSSAVRVQLTPVRVVCQNTLNMAQWDKSQKSIKVRHSGDINLKVRDVQDALGIIREDFKETLGVYQALADRTPTAQQVTDVLTKLFPDTKTSRAEKQRDRVRELAEVGIGNGNREVRGTAWALYNGITELVDHHNNKGSKRPDADDMRLNSNWFGSGANFKADALETIISVVLN